MSKQSSNLKFSCGNLLSDAISTLPNLSKISDFLPVRIQRSRVRKQFSPNTLPIVYAGRPSIYGNPYRVGATYAGEVLDAAKAIELYRRDFYSNPDLMKSVRENLSDKNLSCWCKLTAPCHVDIILDYLAGVKSDSKK